MEFKEYLKYYTKLYHEFSQIKFDANLSLRDLKQRMEDFRDVCGDDLKRFNKINNSNNILIQAVIKDTLRKIKELDKEWNTLAAIIVPTGDLFEEVANYLRISTKRPYRPEVRVFNEDEECKMYYTINLGESEIFRSEIQIITEQHKEHETCLFDINSFYPSQKDVKALKISLYKDDYKKAFAYRLARMTDEEKEQCIANNNLFNIRKNEYLKSKLKDITFEELNEFLITVAENYAFELSSKTFGED